jgi:hypothetical protein
MKKLILLFAVACYSTAMIAQTPQPLKQVPPPPPPPPPVSISKPATPPQAPNAVPQMPMSANMPNATNATNAVKATFKKGKEPQMKFETVDLDYGTIKKSSEPFREFIFKNTGKSPLIISNAVGSCGCTIPTFPKEPIMPGKKAAVKVRYDTERVGAFTKNVTLTTNAPGQESFKLTIHGNVLAGESTGTTPTPDAPKH